MPRLRTVSAVALLVATVVFCGYSIPEYFRLLGHQPGVDALDPTSFPPTYAFFVGGYLAALSFIAVFGIFLLVFLVPRIIRRRKQ